MTEIEWMRAFGKNLKDLISDRSATQKEIAKAADISESTLSRYIAGTMLPSASALNKLFYALDCDSYDELIDLGEEIR